MIEPRVCNAFGVHEPGVARAGSYDFLCDAQPSMYESLYHLAAAFPNQVSLKCLAMQAGVELAGFTWEPMQPKSTVTPVPRDQYLAEYKVAYLFIDGDPKGETNAGFVGRIERMNHAMWALPACGYPFPSRFLVAVKPANHTWRLEAYKSESCTRFNNPGPPCRGALDAMIWYGGWGSSKPGYCTTDVWIGSE